MRMHRLNALPGFWALTRLAELGPKGCFLDGLNRATLQHSFTTSASTFAVGDSTRTGSLELFDRRVHMFRSLRPN